MLSKAGVQDITVVGFIPNRIYKAKEIMKFGSVGKSRFITKTLMEMIKVGTLFVYDSYMPNHESIPVGKVTKLIMKKNSNELHIDMYKHPGYKAEFVLGNSHLYSHRYFIRIH